MRDRFRLVALVLSVLLLPGSALAAAKGGGERNGPPPGAQEGKDATVTGELLEAAAAKGGKGKGAAPAAGPASVARMRIKEGNITYVVELFCENEDLVSKIKSAVSGTTSVTLAGVWTKSGGKAQLGLKVTELKSSTAKAPPANPGATPSTTPNFLFPKAGT